MKIINNKYVYILHIKLRNTHAGKDNRVYESVRFRNNLARRDKTIDM